MQSPVRRKKTKLEKIAELETKCKALKEENNRLRRSNGGGSIPKNSLSAKLEQDQAGDDAWSETNSSSVSEWTETPSIASSIGGGTVGGDADKLKEALRALKRVTVKQEMALATLRQKAKQRRNEIDQKDRLIQKLQDENETYRKVHKDLTHSLTKKSKKKDSSDGDDNGYTTVDALRARVADLEVMLTTEKSARNEQAALLEESQDKIKSLKSQLVSMKDRGVDGVKRNKSLGSVSESSSAAGGGGNGVDVSKLKRELAKKTELIATLQQELEVRRDEIHDLKQKNVFHSSFQDQQQQSNQQSTVGTDDDFFDSDDDDFWG